MRIKIGMSTFISKKFKFPLSGIVYSLIQILFMGDPNVSYLR